MDLDRFRESPVGYLVPISGHDGRYQEDYEHAAYVPHSLPAYVELEATTHTAIGEAMLALGRLDAAATRFPNPLLLVRPAIRREAVSTSALEGTYAAFQDVLQADYLEDDEVTANVSEVHNFVRAAERGVELIKTHPITFNLLRELQAILVRGTPGDVEAGQLRTNQVVIGPRNSRVIEARFIPPPPGDLLQEGIWAWEAWINQDGEAMPFLARVAVGHYQFETLHPFRDGNGRLGRLVVLLQMLETGRLNTPVLNLSPWLEKHRDEYQDYLLQTSATGDFNPFVHFFSEAVLVQSQGELARIARLLELKDGLVAQVRSHNIRSVAVEIAESLIGFPVISVRQAAVNHDVTFQTANVAIGRLVDIGILKNLYERRYDRLFYAPDIVQALER